MSQRATSSDRRQGRSRRTIVAMLCVASCLVGLYFGLGPLLSGIGHWLDVSEKPEPSDCVVLLPGDQNTRPFAAAAVYRAGLAKQIVMPRTRINAAVKEGLKRTDDEMVNLVLRARGVPSAAIVVIDGRSDSTLDDARIVTEYFDEHAVKSIILVTSWYHARRAAWVMRYVLGERPIRVQVVSAPNDDWGADNWWQSSDGSYTTITELFKLAYYQFRFGQGKRWIAGGILVVAALIYAGLRLRQASRTLQEIEASFHEPEQANR